MDLLIQKTINIDTRLDNLLRQINQCDSDEIHLSLINVCFVTPDSIIMLITLSKYIYSRTKNRVIWKNTQENVYAYLERVGINSIPFIELEKIPKKFHMTFSKSKCPSINLIEIKTMEKPKQCSEIISDTKRILHTWYPERIASHFTKQVSDYIFHIAGNSLEHSESNGKGICYYTLQKYEIANSPQVKVAFGDTGMGILNSLQTYNTWIPNSDNFAIKKAFFEGLSSRNDKSGGLGFLAIRNMMVKYGGEIIIRSGRSAMHYSPQKEKPYYNKFYDTLPGTQTVVILK